jgi:hypothetical protein
MRTFLAVVALVMASALASGCGDDECNPIAPVLAVQPLAQLDAGVGGGSSMGSDTLWVFFVSSNDDTLFDLLVTQDDDGTVKSITPDLYPELTNAAATLTDGVDDGWTFWVRLHPAGGGAGIGRSESAWIEGGLTGGFEPDLEGAEVTSVIRHLDYVFVDNQETWTDFGVDVRIVIMGKP